MTRFEGVGQQDEHAWQGLLRLGTLIDVADSVSERLFGLSQRCTAGEVVIAALAAGRGMPLNPSREARAELRDRSEHERQYGPGEVGGDTYATWQEIKGMHFEAAVLNGSEWGLLFELIDSLERSQRYSDTQIRLIVWHNW